jgi:phosphoribosylformimino-5-aminoimidazole carboxamide ribotide isomerase
MARRWVDQGGDRLHLVDLDAARDGSPANDDAVRAILAAVRVPCQLGGGVRNAATIERLLDMGLSRLVVGTAALKKPDWFAEMCDRFPGKLCVGIDARDGMVATDGWLETSKTSASSLARDLASRTANIAAIIYTDIARDGMMVGPNLDQLRQMLAATSIPVVASGGVTTLNDVQEVTKSGAAGCIIGRTLYDGCISLSDAIEVARSAQPR